MEYADRNYFIPFTREQITKMLLDKGKLDKDQFEKFEQFCLLLNSIFHFEFHRDLEELKSTYRTFNPDIEITAKEIDNPNISRTEDKFSDTLAKTLNEGNFEKVSNEDLHAAMEEEGIFPVSCVVDFDAFEYYEIYYQGTRTSKDEIKTWIPFKSKEIEFKLYDRIIFFYKVKNQEFFESNPKTNKPGIPGKIYIKFFRNIPESDLEMIFPNPKPEMKFIHKMQIFLPLLAGFGVLIQKTIIGPKFYNTGTNPLEEGLGYGLIALLIVLGGYVLRTFLGYKNVVQSFLGEIAQSLYFKDKGNNQGVFSMLIDSAEEQECKEALMAYYFLLTTKKKMNQDHLDDNIEEWLDQDYDTKIDFEIDDALIKLDKLGLMSQDKDGLLTVVSIDKALEKLDYIWDNYFKYNKA